MIAEIAQDLVTKIKASTSFGTTTKRIGLAAGAKGMDPMMEKAARPAAWVIFVGDENLATGDQGECGANVKLNFIVKVIVDYSTEADLIDNQYPLFEEVINLVHGQSGPLGAKRWKYEGQSIDELTGSRMVFDQRYSIVTIL